MPDTASLDDFILSAISRACDRDRDTFGPQTHLGDLEIDSLQMVGIVAQVEAAFDRRFESDTVLEFFLAERVEDLVTLMR